MKKIVMIHEVTDKVLNTDLSSFDIITFDDGLYSQYKNAKHFLQYNKPLYFFVSTGVVCPEDKHQNENVLTCSESHILYRENGDTSNYMKWSQIKELYNTNNCYIGGHSHTHLRLEYGSLKDLADDIGKEVFLMMLWFNHHNIIIDSFCYPYNDRSFIYDSMLKPRGITKFFGSERIDVNEC